MCFFENYVCYIMFYCRENVCMYIYFIKLWIGLKEVDEDDLDEFIFV